MVDGPALRIVFFGTPMFSVPSFEALLHSRHALVGVVTQRDRPRGRGQRTSEPPVKTRALAAGLPVLQPERLKDEAFLERLAELHADLGVVAAYGKLLTDPVLAAPRLGLINVHASLLPRYRGAAPIHRAVMNGERETGVTLMRVVKALDAGPMLATARRPIGPNETSEEVERALAQLGADLLIPTIDRIASGPLEGTGQDDAASTYAPRLTKEEGAINWTMTAERVHNLIRGLHPWPHAFTFFRGRRLIVLHSVVSLGPTGHPGTILEAGADRLVVAAGRDAVAITEIQVEGKRPMTAREFLAGHPLAVGEVLTPQP